MQPQATPGQGCHVGSRRERDETHEAQWPALGGETRGVDAVVGTGALARPRGLLGAEGREQA